MSDTPKYRDTRQRLLAVLFTPLGWALHLLAFMPWWWIWLNADCLYLLAYHVLRYRRKIVARNLRESFPELDAAQLGKIERRFYRQFADYFFETVKLLHMTDADVRRRMTFEGAEQVSAAAEQGQNVMLYGSHIGNWEWLTSITMWFSDRSKQNGLIMGQAYHPLENQWFDRFFLHLRSRYSVCFPSHQIMRVMIRNRQQGRNMVLGFLSDQHPLVNDQEHVVEFLHHPTAIITGTESIARKLDMAVFYFEMHKTGRSRYHCRIVPMARHAAATPKGALSNLYAQLLEANIKADPGIWLWTHNRWKRPVQYNNTTPNCLPGPEA